MKHRRLLFLATLLILLQAASYTFAQSEHVPASSIPTADLIQPADLAASLQSASPQPLILQVGSHVLFAEAHIPGSEYAGPTNQPTGIQSLKDRVAALPKDTAIVLYCGCCPWIAAPTSLPPGIFSTPWASPTSKSSTSPTTSAPTGLPKDTP